MSSHKNPSNLNLTRPWKDQKRPLDMDMASSSNYLCPNCNELGEGTFEAVNLKCNICRTRLVDARTP